MTDLQLADHIDEILTFIADDIETAQTAFEQVEKSHGRQEDRSPGVDTAAQTHAALRHTDGFDVVEMVSEYRALRASIAKLWSCERNVLTDEDVLDLGRFNEAIDQALAESVVKFTEKVDEAKHLLLGVLGHDIRSPVGAIRMAAGLVPQMGLVNKDQSQLLKQIEISADRVQVIVSDLLDMAKSKAGHGLPLKKAKCCLTRLCNRIVDETRLGHPGREIFAILPSTIEGYWDEVRLGQLLGNLLANAVQYGAADMPIIVHLSEEGGGGSEVLLAVTNGGDPIPATHLDHIFKSFSRGPDTDPDRVIPTSNLGLGLFISKEIVSAHGGSISVRSGATQGTTFSVRLPKFCDERSEQPA